MLIAFIGLVLTINNFTYQYFQLYEVIILQIVKISMYYFDQESLRALGCT